MPHICPAFLPSRWRDGLLHSKRDPNPWTGPAFWPRLSSGPLRRDMRTAWPRLSEWLRSC